MNNTPRLVVIVTACIVGIVFLWQSARGLHFQPRAELVERLQRAESQVHERERALDGAPRLQRQLREVTQRTLGGDVETVDHLLRTRLSRISEDIGLERASINTGAPTGRRSPAANMFRGRSPLMREMSQMIDFTEVDGSITAEGSLAQIIALIDRIEAEEWIKRIHEVRLNPQGPTNGERFAVTVRLRTLFIPSDSLQFAGREGSHDTAAAAAPYDELRLARFASLIETNPFRLPPPPAPPQAQVQSPPGPPSPPRFPYRQWVLTGLAESPASPAGVEVWLLNRNSGERRVLSPGETLGEAVFVAVRGDEAIFEIGESQFLVQVGGNLDHRTPVNK